MSSNIRQDCRLVVSSGFNYLSNRSVLSRQMSVGASASAPARADGCQDDDISSTL